MEILITLLIICAIAGVAIWLIGQIPAPIPPIVKSLGIIIVVVLALVKVLALF